MSFTIRDTQARCAALGFSPGPIDGLMGPKTRGAIASALKTRDGRTIPDLFHHSGLHRIHGHWTAGAYGAIKMELRAYNEVIDADGQVYDGQFRPEAQARYQVGKAASHTLHANSGAIGIAIDAMAGANERPFKPGSHPITEAQIDALAERMAFFCAQYDIPVSPWSVLTHSEVQPNLGIRQRWKWDINWLPGMDEPAAPNVVGDRLREMVSARLADEYGIAA